MTDTVGVLGPGAVGGALAVPLALAGVRVICVARPETAAAIEREGLTIDRQGAALHARPEATEALTGHVDVLLVTVKAPALRDALERIVVAPQVVLPLLNGLEHIGPIRARLGRCTAASIGGLEAYRDGPTRIVQTTATPVLTVAPGGGRAAEILRAAGFEVRVGSSEREVLWEKAARLAVLAAATAISQRPVGELRVDAEWRPRLEAAVVEACAVATVEGVPLAPAGQWAIIDAMPARLTTSTARDVAAGRPSELDAITGAVVRAARRVGVPAPELERLWEEACRPRSR